MAGKKVKVTVVAETRKFARAFRNLSEEAGLTKFAAGLKQTGKAVLNLAGVMTAGASLITGKALQMGADLEQSTGAVEDVFKKSADTVKKYASNAANAVGLSKNSYQEMAVLIASQLKNAGVPMDQLAGKTNDLIVLASDLSAMFGGETKDAVSALSSALKGERDPIERYGVSLKQAAIDAKALELGFVKTKNGFSQEAQAAATLALIYEQTADAKGKFARETNTAAHQMQVLKANIATFMEVAGAALLPILTEIAAKLSAWLIPKLEAFAEWIQTQGIPRLREFIAYFKANFLPTIMQVGNFLKGYLLVAFEKLKYGISQVIPTMKAFARWVKENRAWLYPLVKTIGMLVIAFAGVMKIISIVKALKVAFLAAKGVMLAFNAAVAANPLIALAAVLIAIGVAIYNFLQENDAARAKLVEWWNWIVQNAVALWEQAKAIFWAGVQYIVDAWNWLKTGVISLIDGIVAKFWEWVNWIASIPSRVWNGLKTLGAILSTLASDAWNYFKNSTINGFTAVYNYITSIPTRIKNALGNLGTLLWNAGASVIQGFLDGITSMFGKVKDKLGALTSWLPDWKGPAARDAVILRKSGQLVIGGFIRGLEDQYGSVKKSLTSFTDDLSATVDLTPSLSAPRRGSTTFTEGGNVYHITVNTLEPSLSVGKKVMESIQRYQRMNGVRE